MRGGAEEPVRQRRWAWKRNPPDHQPGWWTVPLPAPGRGSHGKKEEKTDRSTKAAGNRDRHPAVSRPGAAETDEAPEALSSSVQEDAHGLGSMGHGPVGAASSSDASHCQAWRSHPGLNVQWSFCSSHKPTYLIETLHMRMLKLGFWKR